MSLYDKCAGHVRRGRRVRPRLGGRVHRDLRAAAAGRGGPSRRGRQAPRRGLDVDRSAARHAADDHRGSRACRRLTASDRPQRGGFVGKLIYPMNVSLDGFVETPDHGLDWASVDDELHTWFNDQMRGLDASLYGRRLYEVMAALLADRRVGPAVDRPMGRIRPHLERRRRRSSSRGASSRSTSTADWSRATWASSSRRSGPSSMATSMSAGRRSPPSSSSAAWSTSTGWSSIRSSSATARRSSRRLDRRIGLKLIDTHVFGSGVVYQGYAATHE